VNFKTQCILVAVLSSFTLFGCGNIGTKSASVSAIYACTAIISLLILLAYSYKKHTRNIWYQMLFICIFVVNLGYFSLSISKNLNEALLANRISYLGSVFLPLTMLMLIMHVIKIECRKWIPYGLVCLGIIVFLIAASPGYSDIYYKEVYFECIDGVSSLNKIYGPWHSVYLYYLMVYFSTMIVCIAYAISKKKIDSGIEAAILACAVFINICVWFLEQMVKLDFEFLSISYIITELFLLGLQIVIDENENLKKMVSNHTLDITDSGKLSKVEVTLSDDTSQLHISNDNHLPSSSVLVNSEATIDQMKQYKDGVKVLTPTEKLVYELYISGNTTKEILATLNIKENTLKFHNKNIYGKLGVSSRKQLIEMYKMIEQKKGSKLYLGVRFRTFLFFKKEIGIGFQFLYN